jgi:hypothetical protein
MSDLRAAAQQALKSLRGYRRELGCQQPCDAERFVMAALEQPEQPVALPCCGYTDASAIKWNSFNGVVQCHNCGQTYTHPPRREWRGLTEEEIIKLARGELEKPVNYSEPAAWQLADGIARAIEAELKERNA